MKRLAGNMTKSARRVLLLTIPLLLLFTTQASFGSDRGTAEPDDSTITIQKKESTRPDTPPNKYFYPFGFQNWDPYEEIQAMREEMDRIFNNFDNRLQMSPFFRKNRDPFVIEPQTDIEETDDQYIVTMNIPGADNGEIKVSLEENMLSVSAITRRSSEETKDRNYIRMERSMGTIHRAMTLPGPVEDDGMTTTYKDGILTVTVQKKKSESGE